MEDDKNNKSKTCNSNCVCCDESDSLLENSLNGETNSKVSSDILEEKSQCASFSTLKHIFTIGQSGCYFAIGLIIISLGFALPTLSENLKLNLSGTSSVVTCRGAGFFTGSLTSAFLESYISEWKLYVGYVILAAIGTLFTPFINFISLNIFALITGIGLGGSETIGNVLALRLWGRESEFMLQFLHLWYCTGCAVSPFLMQPFINEVAQQDQIAFENSSADGAIFRDPILIEGTNLPYVSVPYMIIFGIIMIFIPCSCFALFPAKREKITHNNDELKFRICLLFLLCLFYFIYVGGEVAFLTYLYSFGLSDIPGMGLDKTTSAHLNSVYLFSVIFGQFFAIFISRKFSPTVSISVNLSGLATASITMLLIPYYGNTAPYIFWIAVGLFGFFCASIYGTTFLWAERYITVNAKAACVFIVGASTGEMVLPLLVGLQIGSDPMFFLYFNTTYAGSLILCFVILNKVASLKGNHIFRNCISQNSED